RAVCHLGDADRVSEHELERARLGARAQEPALEVHRLLRGAPALLPIQEERVADVLEDELLPVPERLDRRIPAGPLPAPRAEQEGQRGDVGVQRGRHRGERTTHPGVDRRGVHSSASRSSTACCSSITSAAGGGSSGAEGGSSAACSYASISSSRNSSLRRSASIRRSGLMSASGAGALVTDTVSVSTVTSSARRPWRAGIREAGSPRSRACRSIRLDTTASWPLSFPSPFRGAMHPSLESPAWSPDVTALQGLIIGGPAVSGRSVIRYFSAVCRRSHGSTSLP